MTNCQSVSIVDFIPFGRDNAITSKMLIQKCVKEGLIAENSNNKDREKRRLLEKARVDYTILNLSDGNGYYRPTYDDLMDLQRYIRQERKRAVQTFKNIKMAKKLYSDYQSGRITK